jgi:hypothetical protein
LRAHTIRLADEGLQRRIDVAGRHKTKVVPKAERSKILNAPEEPMRGTPPQPETRIQGVGTNDGAREAHAGLDDDPTLLRVGPHWTTLSGNGQPTVPRFLALDWFATEVLCQRHSDAGVPEIPGDESVSAPRTLPEWRL